MTTLQDPMTRRWMHELELLRQRVRRSGGGDGTAAVRGLATDALATSEALLQELVSIEVECRRLRDELSTEQQVWQRFFDAMPVASLVTDAHGTILGANRAAALFLNASVLRLRGQTLMHYVLDRETLIDLLERQIAEQAFIHVPLRVRPREKAIREIDATIVPDPGKNAGAWIWFLMPAERGRQVRDMTSSGHPGPVETPEGPVA